MIKLPVYPKLPSLAIDEVEEPLNVDPDCELCVLHERAKTVCMSPELVTGDSTKGTLLVIGQGPGEAEDRHSRPNVGQSGQYLRDQLSKQWGGDVVFDNAVRCAPGARKLTKAHWGACRPYIARTFEEAKPTRVLCLGAAAINSVMGRGFPPMSVRNGYTHSGTTPVFFLFHPVMALRNRFLRQQFEDALTWALSADPPPAPQHAMTIMVEKPQDVQDMLDDCELAETVAWDIETFGAPFNREFTVLNLAVTPEGCDYAYVLEQQQLDDPAIAGPVFKMLRDKPSGGQNVKFDVIGLRAKYDIKVDNIQYDTMLWRRLIEPDALAKLEYLQAAVGMAGAKDEAAEYVDAGARELRLMVRKPATLPKLMKHVPADKLAKAVERIGQGDKPKRYSYAAIPPDVRSVYNAKDTISTERVRDWLAGRFEDRPDLRRVWDEIVCDLNYTVTQMEFNGISVSRPAISQLQAAMTTRIDEIQARLDQHGEGFSANSSDQVGKLLFETLGLPNKGATPTGKYKCTAEILAGLNHPVADDIVAIRKAGKFRSQYANGMAFYVRDDGRIHPNYHIVGTGTGRMSCSEPNLFNIPRPTSPEGKMCRDIFAAPDGKVLMEFDYSQIELRVAAMLSGDELMIDLFKQGVDFHLATAKMIAPVFNLDPATITKEHPLRDQSKTVNFAVLYGTPVAGLAAQLSISMKLAGQLHTAILGKYKRLKAWIQQRLAHTRRTGVTRTWWGGSDFRERPLWNVGDADGVARDTAERSAWNTPVQGTAAEYTNASMIAVQQWIEADFVPAKLVMTVYDSIMLEVDEAAVSEVTDAVRGIMQGWPTLHDVPIVSDLKVGAAWGSMTGS